MNIFSQISLRIIKEQELIIGPMAWHEARKVRGLKIQGDASFAKASAAEGKVDFVDDEKEVINRLVAQYERLFGKTSHAVCREAVQDLIAKLSPDQVPSSL